MNINEFILGFTSKIELAEDAKAGSTTKVQILRIGKNYNAKYGEVEVKMDMIESVRDNLNSDSYELDIPVKISHSDDSAAGWFKLGSAKVEEVDGETWLTALVEWTELGIGIVRKKIKKYISGEITHKMQDAKTGKDLGQLMFGAALTSQPVIRGQQEILASIQTQTQTKEEDMDVKKQSEYIELDLAKKAADNTVIKLSQKIEKQDKELLDAKENIDVLTKKIEAFEAKELEANIEKLSLDAITPNDKGQCKMTSETVKEVLKPMVLSQGYDVAKKFLDTIPAMIELGMTKGTAQPGEKQKGAKTPEEANAELESIAKNHVNNLSLSETAAIEKAMADNQELVKLSMGG